MTEQEKQEIILAVLGGLKVHSMTIDQLTESTTVGDSDYIELNGGRKISFKKFSELVLVQIAENIRMKANLNTQNALATGEEQRLVIRIIEQSERPVVLKQGVYYNENSQHIETYEVRDMHGSAVLRLVLSEEPSKNVVYCDKDTNTLLRWDGAEMVKVGGGGEIDAYTKSESDKRFAKLSNSQQVISLGYALFGNEEYEVRVDGEGIMWVNGERVVTTDDETQHVFAELVKAVTVKAEELWLGQNENVLTVENGKLKVDGKSILEDVSGEDIPLESGGETTVYDAVIDLYGKVGGGKASAILRPFDDIQKAYTLTSMDFATGVFNVSGTHEIAVGDYVTIIPKIDLRGTYNNIATQKLQKMINGAFPCANVTSVNGNSIEVSGFVNSSQSALDASKWIIVKIPQFDNVYMELPQSFKGKDISVRIQGFTTIDSSWNNNSIYCTQGASEKYTNRIVADTGHGTYLDDLYEFYNDRAIRYDLSAISGVDTSGAYRLNVVYQGNYGYNMSDTTHICIPKNFALYGNIITIKEM